MLTSLSALAVAATLLAGTATASPIAPVSHFTNSDGLTTLERAVVAARLGRRDVTPAIAKHPAWKYLGCYGPEQGLGIMSPVGFRDFINTPQTADNCFALGEREKAGAIWLAGEYCSVTSGIQEQYAYKIRDEALCLAPCADNAAHACGVLFAGHPAYQWVGYPPPATHYSNAKWTYKGCYKSLSPSNRASGMTVNTGGKCLGVVNGQPNDQKYGAIKGSDCWGLRTLGNAVKVDDAECSVPCTGDATQLCGNPVTNRYEVFDRVLPQVVVKVVQA
ncbi:hypothetical protein JCM10207_001792 [Rhodosporidiobolus poonsookiae]